MSVIMRWWVIVLYVALGCGYASSECPPHPSAFPRRIGEVCYANGSPDCDGSGRYATDLTSDRDHCGACGAACRAGQDCVGGRCAPACAPGRDRCGTPDCQDLRSSPTACGACGAFCHWTEVCDAGRCAPRPCASGGVVCGGPCVDLQRDDRHCGACFLSCGAGERCVGGRCVCPGGAVACPGLCGVDLQRDRANCGACGRACGDLEVCDLGRCGACAPGKVRCGDVCADLLRDRAHCGACGRACGAGERCVDGACACDDPARACPGFPGCVDQHPGVDSCASCRLRCPAGSACAQGACVGPELRMLAPLSTMSVTSARPWFRWVLPDGAEGVLVELCAEPSCAAVERAWLAEGNRSRAPAALPPGVHFWRVSAVRGGVVAERAPAVWELVVPASFGARPDALGDINRDGVADRVDTRVVGSGATAVVELEVYFERADGAPTAPVQRIPMGQPLIVIRQDGIRHLTYNHVNAWGVPLGDLNGDGYGEVAVVVSRGLTYSHGISWMSHGVTAQIHAGGPAGISTEPILQGAAFASSTTLELPSVGLIGALGDLDGDGYGEAAFSSRPSWTPNLASVVRGGVAPTTALPIGQVDHAAVFTLGDFNADGYTDVITNPYPSTFYQHNFLIGYGQPAGEPAVYNHPEPCTRWETNPSVFPTYTVLDVNDDGYDDLRVHAQAFSSTPDDVLYFGGPTGLRREGCVVFSTGP